MRKRNIRRSGHGRDQMVCADENGNPCLICSEDSTAGAAKPAQCHPPVTGGVR